MNKHERVYRGDAEVLSKVCGKMKKLYIDIDGVLLTIKNTQRPQYAVEFVDFITSTFDCYWLTSHCKEGKTTHLLQYLSPYYDNSTIEKLKQIKPTSWGNAKIEAIDVHSDFYWLDDYVFQFEKEILEEFSVIDRLINVNLLNENELNHIKELLQSKLSDERKYLFLDLDGVLNTCQYSNHLIKNGLSEFDENGSLFDPKAVDNLRYIIDSTHANIVLSSTWRFDGFKAMSKLWNDRNLPGKLIGSTPHLTMAHFENVDTNEVWQKHPIGSRGMEIDEWLRLNANEKLNPYTYAIIDDEDDFLSHQLEHIVLTDPIKGITRELANKVISILNKE